MSYYYQLVGWINVEHDDFKRVVDIIQGETVEFDESLGLYKQGWCWSDKEINWSRYIFFGADVKLAGVYYIDRILRKIANLNIEVSGRFAVQGEDEVHLKTTILQGNEILGHQLASTGSDRVQ
jgi:hypothetical protein